MKISQLAQKICQVAFFPKNTCFLKWLFAAALINFIIACTHTPAPVYDLTAIQKQLAKNVKSSSLPKTSILSKPSQPIIQQSGNNVPKYYQVKPGDTLFSIAWEHSLNHRELAKINQIENGLIYPGQKLSLMPKHSQPLFDVDSLIASLNREVLKNKIQLKAKPSSISKPAKQLQLVNVEKTQRDNSQPQFISKPVTKKTPVKNSVSQQGMRWIWPTNGKILEGFSMSSNKGLDIAAPKGQTVRATAPGKVVYKGDGLRGYGNLVIIKHNDNYLSAYAHNHQIYVSENEVVKAGQRIADVGRSGAKTDKLHFEIRYKGKPVDPLNYLPKRD